MLWMAAENMGRPYKISTVIFSPMLLPRAVRNPLVQPLPGTFGNLGRNTVGLNCLTNFDWVFVKTANVSEQVTVQFRNRVVQRSNQYKLRGLP